MTRSRVALIKSRPDRLTTLQLAMKRHPGAVIVACGDYVAWKLKVNGIASIALGPVIPFPRLEILHRDLDKRFSSLVTVPPSRKPWLNASAMKNHFTWQIQPAYQWAVALVAIARRARVSKLIWEPPAPPSGRTFSPALAKMVARAVRGEGVDCEIL